MGTGVANAYALIDGKRVNATYDELNDLWVVQANAPATSSWPQPDHVYTISLHAEDEAGNLANMTANDPMYGDQLKIRVLEKSAPIARIVSPTSMSVLGSNTVDVTLSMNDVGDSGVNFSSVSFKVNEVEAVSELVWNETDGVYTTTYTVSGLNDGTNVLRFSVSDNDGNTSEEDEVRFIVSTRAPTLELISPAEGVITNSATIRVYGTSSIDTPGVSIASVTANGEEISVDEDGVFDYEYQLDNGSNSIVIIATDTAGNKTQILREVIRDSEAPIITNVVAESTVVDASGMIRITFKVTDPE